jgi:hypothetical protein
LADLLPASHLSQGASSTWEKRAGVYFYIHILAFGPIMVICSDLPPERFGACNGALAGGEGWYNKRCSSSRRKEKRKRQEKILFASL